MWAQSLEMFCPKHLNSKNYILFTVHVLCCVFVVQRHLNVLFVLYSDANRGGGKDLQYVVVYTLKFEFSLFLSTYTNPSEELTSDIYNLIATTFIWCDVFTPHTTRTKSSRSLFPLCHVGFKVVLCLCVY